MGRRKKEINYGYEQISLWELSEGYTTRLEQDNQIETEELQSSGIYGSEIQEHAGKTYPDPITGSRYTVSADIQGSVAKVSYEGRNERDEKSKLLEDDPRSNDGVDGSLDVEPAIVSIQENGIFHLNDDVESKLSIVEKYNNNVRAIRTLFQIQKEDRRATYDEKLILAKYTGWGSCSQVFDENNAQWKNRRDILKEMLTIDQYATARTSTLTSFYTPFAIVDNMYRIIDKLGFKSGIILDPAYGNGIFTGRMPYDMANDSSINGIELDEISGMIAQKIYDNANIEINGYQSSYLPRDTFDLIITNCPFGNYKVFDKKYSKYNFDIHNYYFAKSLDMVRDGGLIAIITTSETMDGNNGIRDYINERADFLGAIRLPSNLFKDNGANTHVCSDILFLQRHDDKAVNVGEEWLSTTLFTEHRRINNYFISHPEMVFGKTDERKNQFGTYETIINDKTNEEWIDLGFSPEDEDFKFKKYDYLFNNIMDHFHEVYNEKEIDEEEQEYIMTTPELSKYLDNSYFLLDDKIYFRMNDKCYLQDFKGKVLERVKGMIEIATCANDVIDAQVKNIEYKQYIEKRNRLNVIYDQFVEKNGHINSQANIRVFKNDVRIHLLRALEKVDRKTGEILKEDLFSIRTIHPDKENKHPETFEEAINICLNTKGKIDTMYISSLLDKDEDKVKNELIDKEYVYIEPFTDKMILARDYLSGNIRKKIENATAVGNSKNIKALENVLPELIPAEDITVQLGATWIDEQYIKDFVNHIFKPRYSGSMEICYESLVGRWIIDGFPSYYSTEITTTYSVAKTDDTDVIGSDGKNHIIRQPEYNGWNLLDDVMNSKTPVIYDYWTEYLNGEEVRKSRLNMTRTSYARSLAEQLQQEFQEWIFEDDERRENLVEKYNYLFNSIRLQEYDGSYLTFPEMNSNIKLEEYQKNAVARIMTSHQNTLLSQQVGAGKTFEMISAGMEMRRLHLKNKIMYVVPNHLVSQWGKDFLKLYPQAKILVADKKDFQKNNREIFFNRIATGDWDAIIVAHSSFKRIPMDKEFMLKQMNEEIRSVQYAIDEINAQNKLSENRKRVKVLERTKLSIENNVKRLTDIDRDEGITFDQLGIDYMFVDEAHEFKNLYIYSSRQNVAGIPQTKSEKASDLLMKTQWIMQNGGNVCFATGTPISNTMAELYVMQKYLQNDVLKDMGICCFDAWAMNFGKVVNSFEISVDGNSFKSRERFCKFFNIQELMTTFKMVAEIQTESMLNEALRNSTTGRKMAIPPKMLGGKPKVVVVEPSRELLKYIDNIVERTENIHDGLVNPSEDNMLKVTTDSKKASIDLRLVYDSYPYDPDGKLAAASREISKLYREYDKDKATQLVFCDSSTPNKDRFNVYDEMKRLLINEGVLESEIAFIHDAKTMEAKQKLFDMVNAGKIRVLFGSTAKLGAGTNVQERLIAIHHLDVPWRASDIEQRNGRAFRQGNMYDEIYEIRYVTKKSFDAYSWQMIETKASYQTQLLEGTSGAREMEEDTRAYLSYSEIKSIASGNPLVKEKFEVENEIRKIETLFKMHQKKMFQAKKSIKELPMVIDEYQNKLGKYGNDSDVAKANVYDIKDIRENFRISLLQKEYDGDHMKEANDVLLNITQQSNDKNELLVGKFCQFDVILKYIIDDGWTIFLHRDQYYKVDTINVVGRVNFERMIKRLSYISMNKEMYERNIELAKERLISAKDISTSSFSERDKLIQLRKRSNEINALLNSKDDDVIINSQETNTEDGKNLGQEDMEEEL